MEFAALISSRWMRPGILVAIGIGILIVFPPFRINRLGNDTASAPVAAAFDADAAAGRFWSAELIPAAGTAKRLEDLSPILLADPAAARERFGLRVGLGSAVYYFVQGTVTVVAVHASEVIAVVEGGDGMAVSLRSGPVFGNTLRDGCGLLDLNSFPGLAEYNAVSSGLNRLVEERVQPVLRELAQPGARLQVAGCAPAPENLPASGPVLRIVPITISAVP